MEAIIWISGRTARILIRENGAVIDTNDDWNNIASAQSWVYDTYPRAECKVIRGDPDRKAMDQEWSACVNGN